MDPRILAPADQRDLVSVTAFVIVADSLQAQGAGVRLDFNLISFALSVLSLGLGFFAIWLTWKLKEDADRTNAETRSLLTEIRSDAKAIAAVAMPELRKYGEMSRQVIQGLTSGAGSIGIQDSSAPAKEQADEV